jgi:hypothetical protein
MPYTYIDKAYAQKMKLPLTLLANPIPVYNVDGTGMLLDQSLIAPRSLFSFRTTVREFPQK